MSTKVDHNAFSEAVANMSMEKSPFFHEYVFYMHLISQCRISYNENLGAAAGVSFNKDHYILHLNPTDIKGKDKDGKEVTALGFNMGMPLEHRIGILKHEMLHIALGHVGRFKLHVSPEEDEKGKFSEKAQKQFLKFNIAADCALDQEITRSHLPDYAIYPDNFPNPKAVNHLKETAEFYYDMLDDDMVDKFMDNGDAPGGSEGSPASGVGDHSKWLESEGDDTFQAEITKGMVERAGAETTKSRGTLPSNYAGMIENLTIRREVNWKQVLRRIVGNKKANQRKTLLRKDRRMPHAPWIKGRVKDRIFELGVISDVSGSVSDEALYTLWGEIISICDTFKVPVKLVQVDTQPSEPEELNRSCKTIQRKHRGGTYLSPAIEMFKEKGVKYDALVVTTDNYLFGDDVNPFLDLKKPVIWLVEEGGGPPLDGQNSGQSRYVKLTNSGK